MESLLREVALRGRSLGHRLNQILLPSSRRCCLPAHRTARSFARCEPLDPRIVLDGSGLVFDADGGLVKIKLKGAGTLVSR